MKKTSAKTASPRANRPEAAAISATAPEAPAKTRRSSARTKPASKLSAKALTAAVKAIPKTDRGLDALRALHADVGSALVPVLHEAGFLERALAAPDRARKLVTALLELGIDPNARPSDDLLWLSSNPGPLLRVLTGNLTDEVRGELVKQLVDAGASPDHCASDLRYLNEDNRARTYSALDVAALASTTELFELLYPRASAETRTSTLATVLRAVGGSGDLRASQLTADRLRALLALGCPPVGVSRSDLPIAHAAVLSARPDLIEVMLDADPELPARRLTVSQHALDARYFSSNKQLTIGKGATPLGLLELALTEARAALATTRAQFPTRPTARQEADIGGLEQCRALLLAAGAGASRGEIEVPAPLREISTILARWVGDAAVDVVLREVGVATTPFLFLRRAARSLGAQRLAPILDRAPDHVLAYVIDPRREWAPLEHVDELRKVPYGERGRVVGIDPDDYAPSAREVIDGGRLIDLRGDALLCTAELNGGSLWEIFADRAIEHGETGPLLADLDARVQPEPPSRSSGGRGSGRDKRVR